MKLYLSINSPYARKVRVVAHELGVHGKLSMLEVDPRDSNTGLWEINPLGKIPALVTNDETVIYDSPVICEYLNEVEGGGGLLPKETEKGWKVRTLVALGDGVMDAGMAVRMENMRPETERSATWKEKQLATAQRGMDAMERLLPEYENRVNLGSICVACTIAWLLHRHGEQNWLSDRSSLAAWFERFSRRESMLQTIPGRPLVCTE